MNPLIRGKLAFALCLVAFCLATLTPFDLLNKTKPSNPAKVQLMVGNKFEEGQDEKVFIVLEDAKEAKIVEEFLNTYRKQDSNVNKIDDESNLKPSS